MRERAERGDAAGALAAANILLPYQFARLTSSDVRVRHSLEAKSDAELKQEVLALEQRLQLAQTISGEATEVQPEPERAQPSQTTESLKSSNANFSIVIQPTGVDSR